MRGKISEHVRQDVTGCSGEGKINAKRLIYLTVRKRTDHFVKKRDLGQTNFSDYKLLIQFEQHLGRLKLFNEGKYNSYTKPLL